MKLPLSWLKEYVDYGSRTPEELAQALLGIGFEVEEIIYCGKDIDKVVTAKVLSVKKHENSDHLHVCMVDVGNEILQIVCGAPNVKEGTIVPCALVGAKLPGGSIKEGMIRGIKSYGMLCSGKELGIDDTVIEGAEVDGLLILPEKTKVGQDVKNILGLNDYVLDVSITANRPDCQSIIGVSREVAAAIGVKFNERKHSLKRSGKLAEGEKLPTVEVRSDICSRYTGTLIKNVKIEKSPKYIRDRLRMVGIRPINNIVDITNYVLTEVGQPLHSFDRRYVDSGIIVRKAEKGEKITALDGKTYDLDDTMLVIADAEKPVAIAGVMGGEYSGIMPDTKEVFLEAANFERSSVRITSRKLGLRSDSSARYEKGVDCTSVDEGRQRAIDLVNELHCGDVVEEYRSVGKPIPEKKVIVTSIDKINSILGISIPKPEIVSILKNLDIDVKSGKGNEISCTIPLYREDIEDFADLSEEVIRYYGYDNLESSFLKCASCTLGGVPEKESKIQNVKLLLTGLGCDEALNYSFINEDFKEKLRLDENDYRVNTLKLCNPLNKDTAVMRTQLVSCMLNTLALNLTRGNEDIRLFELGRVYIPSDKLLPDERYTLSVGLCGNEDFYSVKAIVDKVMDFFNAPKNIVYSSQTYLHPGKSGDYYLGGKLVASFGEVHPTVMENFGINKKVYVAEIDLDLLLSEAKTEKKFSQISKFPRVTRDLAFTVKDEVNVGDIIEGSKKICGAALEDVALFDVYKGEQIEKGMKSLAFKYKFRLLDRTLEDKEIQELMAKVMAFLEETYGAEIRK